MLNPLFFHEPDNQSNFKIKPPVQDKPDKNDFIISRNIEDNIAYIKYKFQLPKNNDIVIREITLKGGRSAAVLFIDGMVNSTLLNSNIIEALLLLPQISDEELLLKKEEVLKRFIAHNQAQASFDIYAAFEEVNFGGCAVFVDGIDMVFIMDVRFWEHRSINKPENEQSIYGPKEAFGEILRTNSALIRKILKTEKLICEGIKIGNVSKTRGVMMYISDIANDSLVEEVRRRLNSINVDYIFAAEEVGRFVEDEKFSITNQVMTTERPDRAARFLADGRVVFLLNGSPSALVFPTNAFELTHDASDAYLKTPFANAARVIRLISMLISVLLPGTFLALILFHQEMIPTYLMYSISAARENVPFPSIVELLLMDFAFEMIREAGLRMPGSIGSTLGIVGGLILGQAAVNAKIVSPIMIIVVAITGIGSFATANYTLAWAYRLLRFAFVILGSLLGFYGIAAGIFLYSAYLGSLKSFGVNFLSPDGASMLQKIKRSVFTQPLWDSMFRPEFLRTKRVAKEAKISRRWLFDKKE